MDGLPDHIGNLPAYRQNLADKSVNGDVTAVERIRARIMLLISYLSADVIPDEKLPKFMGLVDELLDRVENLGGNRARMMNIRRELRELEDRIYIPIRRNAAAQFDSIRRERPDLTGNALLKNLVGDEINEYRARNPDASDITVLATLMRSSPRADILINMIRQRNDEHTVTVFSWCPLELPLQGV